ncbi:MAG: tRNA (adenosine(37)-N6)-threonylcarbamoyltransferase complex transferase subunit TsaD [Deltaproteobacteria bacterium]|nr:tRNA (adenosine(37)-N6)-threonylcarbamoyltransferase complex transferase subunit TsaD [Deltaproteobacteria bacterium]
MKILAVDTSCDDSCVAMMDSSQWQLNADVVLSHVNQMSSFGGVVPEIASREHLKGLPMALDEALTKACCSLTDIDWFAVTQGPGLVGSLLVGVSYVKALAFALQKPFSILNHVEAHLFSPLLATLEGKEAPQFPWIALVASGGHTELFVVRDLLTYEWLGGTVDDAAGEAFDKVGKLLGLGYPAGPAIDRWVKSMACEQHHNRFAFPRAKMDGYDFSFSGLKTAVMLQTKKLGTASEDDKLAIATCAQDAIVDALCENVWKAQEELGIKQSVVCGGVACNERLRAKLPGAFFPAARHCTDNAAMIALLAGLYERCGRLQSAPWNSTAKPSLSYFQKEK